MPPAPTRRGTALLPLLFLAPAAALRLDAPEGRPRYSILDPGGEPSRPPSESLAADPTAAACVALSNQGSHYTLRAYVGTPPHPLDLVADTGSDAVIVNSCQCRDTHGCEEGEKCYPPHRSSTFNQSHDFRGHAHGAIMSFGSGVIESRLGSDVVRVGPVSAQLTSGLFMLVNKKLNIKGPFEGIFGLGPPHERLPNETDQFNPYGFLEASGISRFSICLNRGGRGFLRLGTPPLQTPLGSAAKAHWGLNFHGMTVGNWHLSGFCSQSSEDSDAAGPCGAMPDSGTTLIAAPAQHLKVLFSSICDHWPRCNASFAENPYKTAHKWFHFERMLVDCHDWAGLPGTELNSSQINEELPHLRFTLAGRGGERQQLKLTGEEYLVHMLSATHLSAPLRLGGMTLPPLAYQGKHRKLCSPAFHPMNATSANMGQIWIMGLPILHKYQVSYDRGSRPPSMSFSSAPCDGCDEVRLASGSGEQREQGLLWLDEPPQISPLVEQLL